MKKRPMSCRSKRNRTLWGMSLLVILAGPAPGIAGSSSEGPSRTGTRVQRLETELSRERQKFELFDTKEKDLLFRLSTMEKEVADKRVELAVIRKEIQHSSSVIRSLQQKKATFEQSLRSLEDKLMERVVALYKYARRGYMKILATATDFDQFRLRVKYLKAVMEEDQRTVKTLVAKRDAQEEKIDLVRKQLTRTQSTREAARKKLAALKKDLETKVILLVKTHKEKEFYQTAIKELKAGAEALKNTLIDLEKSPARYGGEMRPSAFLEEKGLLPLPLEGRVLEGRQVLGASAGRIRRGIYIESSGREEVRCIFPGRVAFSGTLKGYGDVIIVNHGSRFFTVFAELGERTKKTGDQVNKDDVIALVGSREGSGLTRLYFEIRHGEEILDTAKWLKTR